MDNVTAALLGAAIGSLASIIAAVAGPSIAGRATWRREQRRDLREEIANVLSSLMSLLASRRSGSGDQLERHTDAVTAVTRLSVLLGPRESDVEKALNFALDLVSNDKIAAGAAAINALRVVLHEWYRGEIRGKKIGDRYAATLGIALDVETKR